MAEHVANGDALWHRGGIEEIEPGGYRLQQAKVRRGREPRPPNLTNASNEARCVASASPSRIEVSSGVFTLARMRGDGGGKTSKK